MAERCCIGTGKDCTYQFSTAGVPETQDHVQMWLYARHCSVCGCVEKLSWKGEDAYWECIYDCSG